MVSASKILHIAALQRQTGRVVAPCHSQEEVMGQPAWAKHVESGGVGPGSSLGPRGGIETDRPSKAAYWGFLPTREKEDPKTGDHTAESQDKGS